MVKKNKRGISPIIATILLIALVVVIGMIVFMWFKGMTQEAITKFDGTNIDLVCNDVQFDANYANGVLYISNTGNVPIYSMNVKLENSGSYETNEITIYNGWPEEGINQGGIASVNGIQENYEKITLTPILLGLDKDGNKKTQACKDIDGKEIFL